MKNYFLVFAVFMMSHVMGAIINVSPGLNTIQPALINAASGDLVVLLPGTFTMTFFFAPIEVDNLSIEGSGVGVSIVDASALTTAFVVSADNAQIFRATFIQNNSSGTLIDGGTGFNITIRDVEIQQGLNAITQTGGSITVRNSVFTPLVATGALSRSLFLSGPVGSVVIENNVVNPHVPGAQGMQFCTIQSQGGTLASADITLKNTTMGNANALESLFFMDGLGGIAGSCSLLAEGNVFQAQEGSLLFSALANFPADLFSSINVLNNIDMSNPSGGYKGLVAFTGTPEASQDWNVATDPTAIFQVSNNVTAVDAITEPNWEAAALDGLFGLNSLVYSGLNLDIGVPVTNAFWRQFLENFAAQTNVVNALSWVNPESGTLRFNIFKNSVTEIYQSVPAKPGTNIFLDYGQSLNQDTVYYVQSVALNGASTLVPLVRF